MLKIAIDREISRWYGITDKDIAYQLNQAQPGEEIEIVINSPGGDVYTGVAIFNLIREAAKTHSVIVKIVGIAASMASYIMLAPRTVNKNLKIVVYENSIVFIHNPWTIMWGNYKELAKEAEYLEKLAAMMGSTYSYISGKKEKDTRDLMDDETYYIGNEIIENGFANELEKINQDENELEENSFDRDAITLDARLRVEKAFENLRVNAKKEIIKNNFETAAALIKTVYNPGSNSEAPISEIEKGSLLNHASPVTAGGAVHFENQNPKQGESMDKEKLKKEHPELYAAIFNEGKEAGAAAEKSRVTALLKVGETSGALNTAAQFIRDGKSIQDDDVHAEFLSASMKNGALNARFNDNPPPVNPANGQDADQAAMLAAWNNGLSGKDEKGNKIHE